MKSPNATDYFILTFLALLWASAFFNIKIATYSYGPITIAFLRIFFGMIPLLLLCYFKKIKIEAFSKDWKWFAAIGIINLVIPFFLIAYGVQKVQSNLAAILMSTTPISATILAHFFAEGEKINIIKIFGIVLGFSGIVYLFSENLLINNENLFSALMILLGCTFYVIGVGLLYSVTGTLNIADLTIKISELTANNSVKAGISFIIIGLMVKAAIFPLHIWLPSAYTFAPSAVAVLLTATATKAALYVLARILFTLLFNADDFTVIILQWVLLPASIVAIFFGTIRAIFEKDIKKLLAFSSLSQIGYITIGLTLGTASGIMASFIHIANHSMMKAALFMGIGAISIQLKKSINVDDLKGLSKSMPVTSISLTVVILSLLGIPLTIGFISKVYLLKAVFSHGNWPILFIIVLTSFLALGYAWQLIENIWMKQPVDTALTINDDPKIYIPLVVLAVFNILFGIYAYPIVNSAFNASAAIFWKAL